MSELHKIIDRFNELNNDNGIDVPGILYRSRVLGLKEDIRQYRKHNEGYESLALIQPVQGVRKYKLRGAGI